MGGVFSEPQTSFHSLRGSHSTDCFANQGEVFPTHHFGGSKAPAYLVHHFSTKGASSHPPRAVILECVGGLAGRRNVLPDHFFVP